MKNLYKILVTVTRSKETTWKTKYGWDCNDMDLKEVGYNGVD
jgi:hypothetical protein